MILLNILPLVSTHQWLIPDDSAFEFNCPSLSHYSLPLDRIPMVIGPIIFQLAGYRNGGRSML